MKMKVAFRVEFVNAMPRLFEAYCCAFHASQTPGSVNAPRRVNTPTSTKLEQPGGHSGCELSNGQPRAAAAIAEQLND